jgi:hypothetical protein
MTPTTNVGTPSTSKRLPLVFVFVFNVYASRREQPERSESHCMTMRKAQRAAEGVYV